MFCLVIKVNWSENGRGPTITLYTTYTYTSSEDLLKLSESRGVAEQLAESLAAGEHEK